MTKPESAPVRIADVAKAAGVSTATVSRVLGNSSHRVSADTQELVRAAATTLGYRVNPIARALRLATTGSVGMVVPSIANPFFTELVEEVEHVLAADQVNLYLCDARNDPEVEARRLKSLSTGAVDGILVVPVHPHDSEPAVSAAAARVPVVQLDRQVMGLRIPWVGVEDRSGIRDLISHLAEVGVRSMVVFTSIQASVSAAIRTTEIQIQAERCGIRLHEDDIFDLDLSLDAGTAGVNEVFEHRELPDALVCVDDVLALGAINAFLRKRIRVPQDILVTGFDDIRYASVLSPTLTTVHQPLERIAAEGIRLLADAESSKIGIQVALPGELKIRESTSSGLQ